jgi:triphosphatase
MTSDTDQSLPNEPAHKDGREVEWQLACSDLASVRQWLQTHASIQGLSVEPRLTLEIHDTYFDTSDWRIYRAGFALRIRVVSGVSEVTLKSLHSASPQVADRRELTENLRTPDAKLIAQCTGPVGSRVQAVVGIHTLQPLFEVRTARQRFIVRAAGEHQDLGEIALDETSVARPDGEARTHTQRVEVEALTDAHEALEALVQELRSGCALERSTDSKFALGLAAAALTPVIPLQFAPVTIDATMNIEAVARANLRRYLNAWMVHEPAARLGDDPEELHDLRLAMRRLHACLSFFRPYLPDPLTGIRTTLKTLLAVLGEARDFDIALCELQVSSLGITEADRNCIEELERHLISQRVQARARMLNALDLETVQRAVDTLAEAALESPLPTSDAAAGPLTLTIVPALIRTRYKKLRQRAARLDSHSSVDDYHKVRSRVKKLRYALETVSVLYGKPADEMLRALQRLQEKLGVQHDADVAGRRLQCLAGTAPPGVQPETLFLMGRLAERHADTAVRARKRFAKAYRKVSGRRWKALRARIDATASR